MKAVYLKELRSYFTSTLGYVYIAMMLVIFGFYFFLYNLYAGYVDYSYVLSNVTSLILFAMPVLTMRLFADELKSKTDQMLFTAPVSTTQIVLGKFFAALTVFTITVLLTVPQPLTIAGLGGNMPIYRVIGAYIALYLMGITFISIGMFISACTNNPIVALIVSIAVFLLMFISAGIGDLLPSTVAFAVGLCIVVLVLLIWFLYRNVRDIYLSGIVGVIGLAGIIALYFLKPGVYNGLVSKTLNWLSITARYSDFYSGIFTFAHILFYLSLSILFVFLTVQRIEKRRWS